MKTKLRRIILKDFNHQKPKCVRVLKKLYVEYLQFDPMWHFFWEGNVTYIRASKTKDITILLDILRSQKIAHEIDDADWVDNIPITAKYQEAFAHIFHGCSVMAMELSLKKWKKPAEKCDDILNVLERMQHCFLNNIAHTEFTLADMTAKIYTNCQGFVHEPFMLLLGLLKTSFWSGYYKRVVEKRK